MAYALGLFFSFSGKIKRSEFWLATLGLWITTSLGAGLFGNSDVILLLIIVVWFWSILAIHVKRWHDRDKSGIWVLINLIPYVGPIWSLIELGFMPSIESRHDARIGSREQTEQSWEYEERKRETEFKEQQQRRRRGDDEARRAQEESARHKAYSDTQREKEQQTTPPPVSEEVQFAKILGLRGRVTKGDIKKQYRVLAHKYHPDKVSHLGDEFKELADQKFRKINEAYEFFRTKYEIS